MSSFSIEQQIRRVSLRTSARMSIILFFSLAFFLFFFQIRQQRLSIEKKIDIDKEFVVDALSIGDLFFITKYLNAFVDSGTILAGGLKEVNQSDWIEISPTTEFSNLLLNSNFMFLITQGSIIEKRLLSGPSNTVWEFYYAYKISPAFLLFSGIISTLMSLLIFVTLYKMIRKTSNLVSDPIENLSKDIDQQLDNPESIFAATHYSNGQRFLETDKFADELKRLVGEINRQKDLIKDAEVHAAIVRLGRQVNHDIQSPLGALTTAVDQINTNKELALGLIKKSVVRIRSIVADLSIDATNEDQYRNEKQQVNLFDFLLGFVEEKSMEYGDQAKVILEAKISQDLALIDTVSVSRALSNIVNNGVEAAPGSPAEITIDFRITGDHATIHISDNGPGIVDSLKEKIFEYGFSHGKTRGTGTGLAYAMQIAKVHGGGIKILETPTHLSNTLAFSFRLSSQS